MANVEHSGLTDPELHEPKGVAAAAVNKVYVSDGTGSGTWKKITESEVDATSIFGINEVYISAVIPDVSAVSVILVPILFDCTFNEASLVLGNAITAADSSVTFKKNDASSFGSAVTVEYTGSAEGTTFSFTATTNTSIMAGGYIKISSNGASSTTSPLYIVVKLTRT